MEGSGLCKCPKLSLPVLYGETGGRHLLHNASAVMLKCNFRLESQQKNQEFRSALMRKRTFIKLASDITGKSHPQAVCGWMANFWCLYLLETFTIDFHIATQWYRATEFPFRLPFNKSTTIRYTWDVALGSSYQNDTVMIPFHMVYSW